MFNIFQVSVIKQKQLQKLHTILFLQQMINLHVKRRAVDSKNLIN